MVTKNIYKYSFIFFNFVKILLLLFLFLFLLLLILLELNNTTFGKTSQITLSLELQKVQIPIQL